MKLSIQQNHGAYANYEDYNRESTFKQRRANERFAEIRREERRLTLTLDQTANSGKHNEQRRRMKIWRHGNDSNRVCRVVGMCFLQQRKMVHVDNLMTITHWHIFFITFYFWSFLMTYTQVIPTYDCYSMIGISCTILYTSIRTTPTNGINDLAYKYRCLWLRETYAADEQCRCWYRWMLRYTPVYTDRR